MVAVSSSLKTIFKKTERGIVLIHQYKNNGYNIVLDVYSGAVHVVDELCYDVIACLNEENEAHTPETLQEGKTFEGLKNALQDTYSEEELKDALDDVTELAKNGQLFAKDEYECLIEDVKKRKTVVKALCLHIAHDCNLACKYCFAEEGEYHGRRALMDFETGKKALDFLIENSGSRRKMCIRDRSSSDDLADLCLIHHLWSVLFQNAQTAVTFFDDLCAVGRCHVQSFFCLFHFF